MAPVTRSKAKSKKQEFDTYQANRSSPHFSAGSNCNYLMCTCSLLGFKKRINQIQKSTKNSLRSRQNSKEDDVISISSSNTSVALSYDSQASIETEIISPLQIFLDEKSFNSDELPSISSDSEISVKSPTSPGTKKITNRDYSSMGKNMIEDIISISSDSSVGSRRNSFDIDALFKTETNSTQKIYEQDQDSDDSLTITYVTSSKPYKGRFPRKSASKHSSPESKENIIKFTESDNNTKRTQDDIINKASASVSNIQNFRESRSPIIRSQSSNEKYYDPSPSSSQTFQDTSGSSSPIINQIRPQNSRFYFKKKTNLHLPKEILDIHGFTEDNRQKCKEGAQMQQFKGNTYSTSFVKENQEERQKEKLFNPQPHSSNCYITKKIYILEKDERRDTKLKYQLPIENSQVTYAKSKKCCKSNDCQYDHGPWRVNFQPDN